MTAWRQLLRRWRLPSLSCLLCHQASAEPLCRWCRADSQLFSDTPGDINLLRRPLVARQVRHARLEALYALGWYEWPFIPLIHSMKFRHKPAIARLLGHWFADSMLSRRNCPLPDVLLPVPLYAGRYLSRQYNQAREIACAINEKTRVPVIADWAWRTRGRPQHSLNRHQRLSATRAVYSLNPAYDRRFFDCCGRHVAIIDDVMTTGITADVLAGLLRQTYKHIRIEVWVMAITPAKRPYMPGDQTDLPA
ncbi:ComF family protein [Alteromonas sp. CYL-A6]|uniref:ComF family protein n=1 Tax=Alteromonas nitratireducens TaxID=3390813 RepID=UPI0034B41806